MRFRQNPGLVAFLGRSPQVEHELKKLADRAVATAKSIAPVESGAYKDKIVAESGIEGPTVKARVNAKDFKSGWIEFGTSKWPAHATLRLACESVGLRFAGGRG